MSKEESDSKSVASHEAANEEHIYERPTGLKGLYCRPTFQVAMLGFVCFMGPGLFNALSGLGAAGQQDSQTSANGNVALYSTFAVSAFFAGSIVNVIGARLTLFFGSMGYSLYIGSFLASNLHSNAGPFVIAAGAILGLCAGLLWTAQGSLMLAYPTEAEKGTFIGIFWAIFNMGGVVGSAIAFGQNFHSTAGAASNGTYIGFLILTLIGVTIPMLMLDPRKMIRSDGTKVVAPRLPSWKTEIYGLWLALRTDPMVLLLFPMFYASNYFYTWQFNEFNGVLFTIRTRSLNSMIYWLSQIVGSVTIGFLLDASKLSRRVRAFSGWIVVFLMVFVVHIWGFFYARSYTIESIASGETVKLDFSDHGYTQRIFFYIFCGILDAMWQTTTYWLMGAMSNDPAKLAYYVGFYKSIQSASAAGAWRTDAVKTPYINVFLSTWGLLVAGLLFALPMLYLRVKNHTDLEDEVIARMDESGKVLDVQEVQARVHESEKQQAA